MTRPVVRILVQQPALRKYRLPFFREWARREGVSLGLMYGFLGGELQANGLDGFTAVHVPSKAIGIGRFCLQWQPAQWRGARKGACDVLVLSWNVQYLSLVPALLRARCNGIRTVLWGHGYSKRESGLRKALRNAVGRLADALLFYDNATANAFVASGWPNAKVHVAPNSLDQRAIQAARANWLERPDRLAAFQRKHALADRSNIVYIGRIYAENRLDVLIDALPVVQQAVPDVQLLVIGAVNDVSEELQQHAEQRGVSDCIRWFGALYEEDEIAPFMLSSRLFCYPANVGLSIMHAMGYGVPPVTGDHLPSHNPEIHALKDGVNGMFFKHLDAADLARTLSKCLNEPDGLAGMGTRAREAVLQEYTTERMAAGAMEAIHAVLKRNG